MRPYRNLQGRAVPETSFSAVPLTISTIMRPPADGSRVNRTPAYSAGSMRCKSTLPKPPLAEYDAARVVSNDACTFRIAASSPLRPTLSTDSNTPAKLLLALSSSFAELRTASCSLASCRQSRSRIDRRSSDGCRSQSVKHLGVSNKPPGGGRPARPHPPQPVGLVPMARQRWQLIKRDDAVLEPRTVPCSPKLRTQAA